MAVFDVYVEGATDPSPQALRRLAEVMSQRYGLAANDLVTRLTKGRFRVKAGIDQQTATTYAKDLEAIGARVTVAEARAGGSSLPPPRPGVSQSPANRPGPALPPRPAQPSQPPQPRPHRPSEQPPQRPEHAIERPFSPSNAPQNRPAGGGAGSQAYASGLAAAFHENTPIPELGALENESALSLSSVDGKDQSGPTAVADLGGSIGPAPAPPPPKPGKPERPKDVPLDLFAPPESQTGEMKFELAADEIAHRERKKAATPPVPTPVVAERPSTPVLRQKTPTSPPPRTGGTAASDAQETPRWRFASGIVVAIVFGFIPAHCVASVRESGLDTIDQNVVAEMQKGTRDEAQLDAFRDEQLGAKKGKRTNIALVSLLIWGLVGGGIGYVWFRRVPWDKIKFGQDWP